MWLVYITVYRYIIVWSIYFAIQTIGAPFLSLYQVLSKQSSHIKTISFLIRIYQHIGETHVHYHHHSRFNIPTIVALTTLQIRRMGHGPHAHTTARYQQLKCLLKHGGARDQNRQTRIDFLVTHPKTNFAMVKDVIPPLLLVKHENHCVARVLINIYLLLG